MKTLGKTIGLMSLAALMFFGSALDSPSLIPTIGCLAGMAGLATTICIAGLLV